MLSNSLRPAQHPVLLAADQDLAGQKQNVALAPVLDDELGHRRLVALADQERARLARLVERGDLERGRLILDGEPEDQEAPVDRRLAHAGGAHPALELRADLTAGHGPVHVGRLAEHADPIRHGT